jgi:tRNA threonylcarbamoyladenosine biosynthesis protein TsaE
MEWIFSLDEIDRVAAEVLQTLPPEGVVAFYGVMGAGKTTFIKALCRARGVLEVTSSPTFSLVNDYVFPGPDGQPAHLFHLDLYRIADEAEAIQAGIEDCLYSGSPCYLEWPGKIPGLLPPDTVAVTIALEGESRRLSR